jgi:hypothetical protein
MNTCPECGKILEDRDLQYCPYCRFRFVADSAETPTIFGFLHGTSSIPKPVLISAAVIGGILLLCICGWLWSSLVPMMTSSDPSTPTVDATAERGTATVAAYLSRTPTPTRTPPPVTPTRTPTIVPSPTPNRGRVVFVSDRGGEFTIFNLEGFSDSPRSLVQNKGGVDDCPAVSPNGKALVFCSTREQKSTQDLYLQDLQSRSVYQLTGTPGKKNASPSWFPTSDRLAFTSNRDGKWAVYVTNSQGTDVQRLLSTGEDLTAVSVSPDGSMLAYLCGKELCIGNAQGTTSDVFVHTGIQKDHPVWSPDGYKIAYSQSTGNSKSAIYLVDVATRAVTKLVDNGSWPAWSPDGLAIAFTSTMRGLPSIYAYELRTNNIIPLTSSSKYADRNPFWY